MSKNPFQLTENDILDAFNSLVGNDKGIGNNQNFLSSNTNALGNLQGYGSAARSPSWNADQNQEPSSTPGSTSYRQLTSLVLNSVDEEDEFLYGDSNSVPEEQMSSRKDSVSNNTGRLDTGWSDEEDPYGEPTRGASLNKLNSRLRKNLSDYDSQNKTEDTVKFPHIQREDILVEDSAPTSEISTQKYGPHKLESSGSVLLPEVEKPKTKSKYHAAAEILKKQTFEKTNISNSVSDKLGVFAGTSKDLPDDRPFHADLKTDKPVVKKPPKIIDRRHIDNIRDYISGPQRKRPFPREDFPPEKYSRYEPPKSYSPLRHHSPPHRSSLSSSYKHKPYETDNVKYASYSKHRSPSFESDKRHSRYVESHRRYSPSPKRWSRSPDYRHRRRSREKSTDYNRYKDRSPRSRRSKSRSPGYSSRSKTYDKKKSKSSKKSGYYSKKKDSSSDSFCSLSLGSSSSSSDSSSESSDEKKSSKKPPVKKVSKGTGKLEDEAKINLKNSVDKQSKQSDSTLPPEDLSQKLARFFKDGDNRLLLDPANVDRIINAVQPPREQQLILDFIESATNLQMNQPQQPIMASDSSTYTSPTITNINIPSNMQMPVPISSSGSYPYPTMPSAPVPYVTPQIPNFPQMIPSAAFPAPVMATAAPPAEYGPYLTMSPVQSSDSPYITNMAAKNTKARPSTLRTIPVSDNFHVSSSSNITIVPDNSPLQKSTTMSNIEESKPSLKSVKQPVENKSDNLKETKSVAESSSSKHIIPSTAEQNRLSIINKFKRMKAERAKAHDKAKNAETDYHEMKKLLDETFGKKISHNETEKMLYSKCKNYLKKASKAVSQKLEEARRADEDLNKFQARLPTALWAEVSKIKLEQCIDETECNEIYSCLDQGDHLCSDCSISFSGIKEILNHLQTSEHKEQMDASRQDWKKDFHKEQKDDATKEGKKMMLKPVKGAEFLKPLAGFYCTLCKEVFIDETSVEQHLKGHQHFFNYEKFIKGAPIYERKRLFKRLIKLAVVSKQKKLKAIEEYKQKQEEQKRNKEIEKNLRWQEKSMEEKKQQRVEYKKNQEAAEKKVKEILEKEKSKEIKVIELEDDSEDVTSSSSQKATNIKLNLSEKDKTTEKKNSSKELESKNSNNKFVFIGKAPNYKKSQSKLQKPTPWYKRESILNVKELEDDKTPNVTNVVEKVTKNSQSPDRKSPNSIRKTEEASKSDSSHCPDDKTLAPESKVSDVKDKLSIPESSDTKTISSSSSNIKTTSSNIKTVSLSEITLPEDSSLPSSRNTNTPQPMDIDNSQDVQDKPKTEEEKDFQLLGINREDFKPLVIPVPPPTSMVSYPNPSNSQTYPSNNSCHTTSTSNVQHIKNLDFTVPPPTMAPYQNNAQHMPVYGTQNNSQNVSSFSYPNNPQIPVYPNQAQMNLQTNFQTLGPFSTPPPAFRNPPPVHPYSNAGNRPPHLSQFTNTNNVPYNAYSNTVPVNLNNQSYQQPTYSVPPNNQTCFPVVNTSQNLVPPGSEYDTSFLNKNYSTVTTTPVHISQTKVSLSLKKAGNLTIIVPEKTPVQVSKSVSSNKPKEISTKANIQDKSKITSNNHGNKGIQSNLEKNRSEKPSTAINVNTSKLETSKVISDNKKDLHTASGSTEMTDKLCLEKEMKHKIDEKVQLDNCDKENSVKASSTAKVPVVFNNKSEQKSVDEISNIENDSKEGKVKINEKEITTESKDTENKEVTVSVKAVEEVSETDKSERDCDKLAKEPDTDNTPSNKSVDCSIESSSDKINEKDVTMTNVNSVLEEKDINESCNTSSNKSVDFLAEDSNDKANKKDLEMTNMDTMLKEKAINESHDNKNTTNEGVKNTDIDEILEVSKNLSQNIHSIPMSVNNTEDSNDHEVSNIEIENKNYKYDFEEINKNICDKQNSSSDICSLSDNSNKINEEAKNIKNTEVVAMKTSEKNIDGDILDNVATPKQSTETVTSDSSHIMVVDDNTIEMSSKNICLSSNLDKIDAITKDQKSTEITAAEKASEKTVEDDTYSNNLDKIDDITKDQKSTEIIAMEKASKKTAEDDTYSNKATLELSSEKVISDSASIKQELMYANDTKEFTFDDIYSSLMETDDHELSNTQDVNNQTDLKETNIKSCDNKSSFERMEIVHDTVLEKPSNNIIAGDLNVTDKKDEINEKITETNVCNNETTLKESVSNFSMFSDHEQMNTDSEYSLTATSKSKNEKVSDKFIEASDIMDRVKFECLLLTEVSDDNNGESKIAEIPGVNTVEDENINDSSSYKKMQSTDIQNYVPLSTDTSDDSKRNESLQNIEMLPVSIPAIIDSNQNDSSKTIIPVDKSETDEISNLKNDEEISIDYFKKDNCAATNTVDMPSEIGDKKILETIQESESDKLCATSNLDASKNSSVVCPISPTEQKKNEDVSSISVTPHVSHSISSAVVNSDTMQSQKLQNTSIGGPPHLSFMDESTSQSIPEQVQNSSMSDSQDPPHLSAMDESNQTSSVLESFSLPSEQAESQEPDNKQTAGCSPVPDILPTLDATSLSSFCDEPESVSSPVVSKTTLTLEKKSDPLSVKRPDGMLKLYDMSDDPNRALFLDKLIMYQEERGTPLSQCPTLSKQPLDLYSLYTAVKEKGGFAEVTNGKIWKEIAALLGVTTSTSGIYTLKKQYIKYLLPFECKFDQGDIDPDRLVSSLESNSKKKNAKNTSSQKENLEDSEVPTTDTNKAENKQQDAHLKLDEDIESEDSRTLDDLKKAMHTDHEDSEVLENKTKASVESAPEKSTRILRKRKVVSSAKKESGKNSETSKKFFSSRKDSSDTEEYED